MDEEGGAGEQVSFAAHSCRGKPQLVSWIKLLFMASFIHHVAMHQNLQVQLLHIIFTSNLHIQSPINQVAQQVFPNEVTITYHTPKY